MTSQNSDQGKISVTIDKDFEAIIDEYLSLTQNDISELLKSLDTADFEKVETIGHNWKGTGTAYGLVKISEVGNEIEILARSQAGERIRELTDTIQKYIDLLDINFE